MTNLVLFLALTAAATITPSFATAAATCNPSSDNSHQICSLTNTFGTVRWFDLVVPSDAASSSGQSYPALFAFHGGGIEVDPSRLTNGVYDPTKPPSDPPSATSRPESVGRDGWGWDIGTEFFFVVPHGSPDSRNALQWMFGKEWTQTADDYAFIDALLDYLKATYPTTLDQNRIFAQGHSSGGIFLNSWVTGGSKAPQIVDDNYVIRNQNPWRALATSGSGFVLGGQNGPPATTPVFAATDPIVDAPDNWSAAVPLFHIHGTLSSSNLSWLSTVCGRPMP
eukprot:g5066.t1